MSELKPCLRCGAKADIAGTTFGDSMTEYYRGQCFSGDAWDEWCNTNTFSHVNASY